jgi:hypothetical protein
MRDDSTRYVRGTHSAKYRGEQPAISQTSEALLESGNLNTGLTIGRQRNRRSRPVPPAELGEPQNGDVQPPERSEAGERS